ncbi:hypothetical protein GCM10009584_28940 [Ornithinimicrobium humiphilum]|uniref:Nucleoside-diphosphate-sugar epimerase n=1 Tax=Ornithinimicrobium humiphilum TaxID=125288 RepID=A0A543K8A9_9MICO|nr:NAD(P)-dependent oxidoreductase [Ornithinimicrobium humiphilum]TQM91274.1 nucleoside-diphosphate-sugar epimerase [Ornithinimicrobium humiphilum]
MKVVVTGAAGLLGRYAVSRLRASGHQVLGLTRGGVGGHTATDYSVESLAVLLRGADAVVDLAYSRPVTSHHADVTRTIVVGTNVLEAAARAWVRTVVQASSVEVYDPDATRPFREDSPTTPRSPYGMAKLTVERWAQLDAYLEIRTVSLRLSSLIGSGECTGWPVAAYLRDEASARPPHEPPGTVHDLLHVADAARAIELALLTETAVGPVNIVGPHLYSPAQLAQVVDEELHGTHAPPGTWTEPPWRLAEEAVDCSLARRVLGFVPEHDVRSALRERRAAHASGGGCLPARDRAVARTVS